MAETIDREVVDRLVPDVGRERRRLLALERWRAHDQMEAELAEYLAGLSLDERNDELASRGDRSRCESCMEVRSRCESCVPRTHVTEPEED